MSSYPLSKRSTNSRQSERSQRSKNSRYHDQKIVSGKKFQHKKAEPGCSPPKNLKDISVSDFKLPKQSGNKDKRSPNKENL